MPTAAWWGFVGPPATLPCFKGFPTQPLAADISALPLARMLRSSDKVDTTQVINSTALSRCCSCCFWHQHPQHCWQEESPCRSSQALLKELLLMDHRSCCSVWNLHSLGHWWNEWPLKKVSCPTVVISGLCSHSSGVEKKNEVSVLATTIFFFTWN